MCRSLSKWSCHVCANCSGCQPYSLLIPQACTPFTPIDCMHSEACIGLHARWGCSIRPAPTRTRTAPFATHPLLLSVGTRDEYAVEVPHASVARVPADWLRVSQTKTAVRFRPPQVSTAHAPLHTRACLAGLRIYRMLDRPRRLAAVHYPVAIGWPLRMH